MTPSEYLPLAIAAAVGALPIRAVRFQNAVEASGPSVLWRVADTRHGPTMDVAGAGTSVLVEIECRAPTWPGAIQIAEDITQQLQRDEALLLIHGEEDVADDASQERGNYFSHIVVVEIRSSGLEVAV